MPKLTLEFGQQRDQVRDVARGVRHLLLGQTLRAPVARSDGSLLHVDTEVSLDQRREAVLLAGRLRVQQLVRRLRAPHVAGNRSPRLVEEPQVERREMEHLCDAVVTKDANEVLGDLRPGADQDRSRTRRVNLAQLQRVVGPVEAGRLGVDRDHGRTQKELG